MTLSIQPAFPPKRDKPQRNCFSSILNSFHDNDDHDDDTDDNDDDDDAEDDDDDDDGY